MVAGDMNAEPDSDEIRLLEGHRTRPVRPGLVLVDAWRYAEPDAVAWTWDRSNPHVRATLEPNARIDYLFVGLPRDAGLGHIRTVDRFGASAVDGVWPSDHAGVMAEIAADT